MYDMIEIGDLVNVWEWLCVKFVCKEKIMGFGYWVYWYGDFWVLIMKWVLECVGIVCDGQ